MWMWPMLSASPRLDRPEWKSTAWAVDKGRCLSNKLHCSLHVNNNTQKEPIGAPLDDGISTSTLLQLSLESLAMAKDSIPPLHTLERPEKLQDILKQDRGDDCLPCRVIGEDSCIHRCLNTLDANTLTRRRGFPWSCRIQLLFRPLPAHQSPSRDPSQQVLLWYEKQEVGHHWSLMRHGLSGLVQTVQVRRSEKKKTSTCP